MPIRSLCLVSLLALIATDLAGCAAPPPPAPPRFVAQAEAGAPRSLFPSDAQILDDAQLARVLEAEPGLTLPTRLAMLHLEHAHPAHYGSYGFYSALLPATRQDLAQTVANTLEASPAVASAEFLPTFLLPEAPSIGHLREAAARFRAEGVFVYRSECETYYDARVFSRDRIEAYCRVESAVIDVRTGIIPFSREVLRKFVAIHADSDANRGETLRRAQDRALREALDDAARGVIRWLGSRTTPDGST